jgi:hypothetical protein
MGNDDYQAGMKDYSGSDPNAADTQKEIQKAYLANLQQVAKTTAGVEVICHILEMLGTFEPAWSDKNAYLAKQTVLKDFGNDLLDELAVAAEEVHDNIQRMMRQRRKLALIIKN